MGYALALGTCANCGTLFSFNPVKVPSVRVRGVKEPVCEPCIKEANKIRETKGMEPFTYSPDAYSYCEEGELGDDQD